MYLLSDAAIIFVVHIVVATNTCELYAKLHRTEVCILYCRPWARWENHPSPGLLPGAKNLIDNNKVR